MSLITSCPACATMFRVVPDQLKISEGWVRCGHCGEVFDATAHLADEAMLAPEPAPPPGPFEVPAQAAEFDTVPAALQEAAAPPAPSRPPVPRPPPASAAEVTSDFGLDSQSPEGLDSHSLEPSPLDSPFVFRRSDLLVMPERDSNMPPPESGYPSQFAREDLDEPEEPTPAELRNVSFVRQARRKAFWRRPTVRILLALSSLGMAGLLVLQLAWHDRDRLALAQPQLRPALQRMCELLQCRLGPPRQIDAIVIEHSGFNRLRNDNYRVAVTLRNTARIAVAAPAMELTITDGQDQPIARRVLTPAELGIPGNQLPAAGDWSGSIGLAIATEGGTRVAGYRLLAFYP